MDKPHFSDLDPKIFYQQRDIYLVELAGNENCGKTELMLHLIINTIMPEEWNSLNFGGKKCTAIVLDLAYKFPMLRLITLLENRLKLMMESKSCEIDTESFVHDCLCRLYKFNCNSTLELVDVLNYIPQFVNENPTVCLLAIDNIEAFYWIDKLKGLRSYSAIEKALKVLVLELKINIIICRTTLFKEKSDLKKVFELPQFNFYLLPKGNNMFVCSSRGSKNIINTFIIDKNGVNYL